MAGRSVAARAVAVMAVLLAVFAGAVVVGSVLRPNPSSTAPASEMDRPGELRAAVARTIAEGSARVDATYEPANGPPVTITGRTSLVGPESEVFASVGDGPPAAVRVTASGAWVRPPGVEAWTPISPDNVAAVGVGRGWADVLGRLDAASDVRTDGHGRIVRMRLARDRVGGTLDVRLSAFGTEVVTVPP